MPINRLPVEVLLEVFDSYRQSLDDHQYDDQWRKKYAWFNLAHVCRRWRAVVFAWYSRLDLNIVVGPEKPDQIKTILSRRFKLPILVDYSSRSDGPPREVTGSVLWRMRAALRERDRVREISFGGGWPVDFIRELFNVTNHPFPALESLVLCFPAGQNPYIPVTFLRGSDHSDLPLRRLKLYGGSLTSVSGLLLSATALTDLTINQPSPTGGFQSFKLQESILACLQGMQSLCSLDLTTPNYLPGSEFHSTLVPLLKLTRFHYSGPGRFLNNLMSGLSAPSLQDARFEIRIRSRFLYMSRVIDDVREEFRSISVTFDTNWFRFVSSTQPGKINHSKLSFRFNMSFFPHSITAINSTPSTKFAMTEELALNLPPFRTTIWEHGFSLREFLRQFRSVRVLRVSPLSFAQRVGLLLQQADGEAILPLLEEMELSDGEEYRRREAEAVEALKSLSSARERTGRFVKVYHGGPT